jgi:hypothetical protein
MRSLFFLFFLFNTFLIAHNNSPTIEILVVDQRDDGSYIVNIYYNLYDVDADTVKVIMFVSSDYGTTWDFSYEDVIEDIGSSLTSDTSKHIM